MLTSIKNFKRVGVLLCLLFFVSIANAKEVVKLKSEVTDKASLLSRNELQSLRHSVKSVNSTGKVQLAVLIIPSLDGEILEQYSLKVAEQNGLGNKEQDNGALLLVAVNDRKLRIEVGYGIEGALTDALSGRIIDNMITPNFKNRAFYKGLNSAVVAIGQAVEGEVVAFPKKTRRKSKSSNGMIFLVFIGFGILKLVGAANKKAGSVVGMVLVAGVIYFLTGSLFLMLLGIPGGIIASLVAMNSGSYGGGGYYGGGSGGGFSGGGFSGGGGSFGGGGSSGGW